MARMFAPATSTYNGAYNGAYARAWRQLSVAVRAHLTYGFFTWQPVRSRLPIADE